MSEDLQVGQEVVLKARCRDRETGEAVIPDEVLCHITPPAGKTFRLDTTRVGESEWFEARFVVRCPGTFIVTWAGRGGYETQGQQKLYVAQQLATL